MQRDVETNYLAVLRLITRSNLVGWITGRSAGFPQNPTGIDADYAIRIVEMLLIRLPANVASR
jgi:hypothetical protein